MTQRNTTVMPFFSIRSYVSLFLGALVGWTLISSIRVYKQGWSSADSFNAACRRPRILCYINTFPAQYETKAIHVQNTWARRCDKFWFTSTKLHPKLRVLKLNLTASETRMHLWSKMRAILRLIYKELDYFDFFFKADDDTYTIFENLLDVLKSQSSDIPFMTGYRWPLRIEGGYFSGGAGYVLSREALRRIVEESVDRHVDCPKNDENMEDVKMSVCGHAVGVKRYDSFDEDGKSVFCPTTISEPYLNINRTISEEGFEKMGHSYRQATFHYVAANKMYILEFCHYYLRPQILRFQRVIT
ncbi:Glycoprotein-N-acetylgalactosamine 3-beta-galactosyltransferase 1 [Clonorchis sinensis]|uniref:Glycoprotein-N-acetylgalactosamine 3-beta-galactosyltransferase 1 n=2 Tax=Clonorchis sinensis TaxID=79923 RepID=A0A8T1ME72_CLOSI|nr:Glycoprotein-N-acetylgalactosamine 3-beta-galactosyltransferase 1 [Clonorchis sinensis]